MRNHLILLPGWGLGISPLEPLAAALQGLDEHLRVEIEPLPELESSDLEEWLDELDSTVPQDAWLGGWSLGGMLASELAARRGESGQASREGDRQYPGGHRRRVQHGR